MDIEETLYQINCQLDIMETKIAFMVDYINSLNDEIEDIESCYDEICIEVNKIEKEVL